MSFFDEEEPGVLEQRVQQGQHSKTVKQVALGEKVATTVAFNELDDEKNDVGCQDDVVRVEQPLQSYQGAEVLGNQGGVLPLEGMKWNVEYYSQILGVDSEPAYHSVDTLYGFQQYRRVLGFTLSVDNPLSFSFSEEYSQSEMQGVARCYPVVKPNVGDTFIAEIGEGRLAQLDVTEVRRLSHLSNSAFEMEYRVRAYLTDEVKEDLLKKTIVTYQFNENGLIQGGEGLLEEGAVSDMATLEKEVHRLIERYFRAFLDEETMSLSVPVRPGIRVYDYMQAKFVDALVDKRVHSKWREVKLQRMDYLNKRRQVSIWDALLERDWMLMDDSATYFNFISKYGLRGSTYQWNMAFSRYDYVIYPYHLDTLKHVGIREVSQYTQPAELPLFNREDTTLERRLIYRVQTDEDYVFSHYFYLNEVENMSVIEVLVKDYLSNKPVCVKRLLQLIRASYRWDDLDAYYYIPILILLAKVTAQL